MSTTPPNDAAAATGEARGTGSRPDSAAPTSDAKPTRLDAAVDVWWGSYSSRTLLPSWIVCLLLALGIAWSSWNFQIRGIARLSFLGLACLVCLYQFVRWANRVFGYNYRLTSRQLFCERRFMARTILRIDLESVARVRVERTGMEALVGVGRVVVELADGKPPVVLEGVREPQRAADLIRAQVYKERS